MTCDQFSPAVMSRTGAELAASGQIEGLRIMRPPREVDGSLPGPGRALTNLEMSALRQHGKTMAGFADRVSRQIAQVLDKMIMNGDDDRYRGISINDSVKNTRNVT